MENKKIVIGNQKMYMSVNDISDFLKETTGKITSSRVIICPSSIYIPYFLKHRYSVGVQNINPNDQGQYTGEISAKQANEMGIKYGIVGHSERRIHFDEDNETVNSKVQALLRNKVIPILCIGETSEEKNLLKTNKVLKSELVSCLKDIKIEDFENIIIAYEPIWAIGTNRIPTVTEIKNNVKYIKDLVQQIFKCDVKVVYGGSVNEKNIERLNKIDLLDGFLVGGSSTKASEFLKIIEVVVNQ